MTAPAITRAWAVWNRAADLEWPQDQARAGPIREASRELGCELDMHGRLEGQDCAWLQAMHASNAAAAAGRFIALVAEHCGEEEARSLRAAEGGEG